LSEAQARLPSFNGDIAQVERRLWESADQLRANSNLSASEYSVPVLGLRANIGMAVNEAMRAVEAENEELKDVLPKTYNRLDNATLVALLKNFSEIPLDLEGDVFGRIYEYFLGKFAMSEGQRGGGFFTPTSIVRLIVEIM
jgi:type I restriction-modification system DNA methylase subunit